MSRMKPSRLDFSRDPRDVRRSTSNDIRSSAEVQRRQRSRGKKAARIVNAVGENRSSSLSTVTNCNSGSRTRCRVAMVRVINCNVAAVRRTIFSTNYLHVKTD